MDVGNGVHLHRHILEIFVPNLKGQKTDFTALTFNASQYESKDSKLTGYGDFM